MKHVTEWGLGLCAGVAGEGKPTALVDRRALLEARGLRPDTIACTGAKFTDDDIDSGRIERILSAYVRSSLPTCPRCAVLRDAALEGRLPPR